MFIGYVHPEHIFIPDEHECAYMLGWTNWYSGYNLCTTEQVSGFVSTQPSYCVTRQGATEVRRHLHSQDLHHTQHSRSFWDGLFAAMLLAVQKTSFEQTSLEIVCGLTGEVRVGVFHPAFMMSYRKSGAKDAVWMMNLVHHTKLECGIYILLGRMSLVKR